MGNQSLHVNGSGSYIVGRFWSFDRELQFIDALFPVLCELAGAVPKELKVRLFNGSYERTVQLPETNASAILPARLCSLTIRSSSQAVKCSTGQRLDLRLQVAPLSEKWAKPKVVSDATRNAQRLAMADQAADESLRRQPITSFPHHIDFQVTRQGCRSTRSDVDLIASLMRRLIESLPQECSIAGGVDVVDDYARIGELGLAGVLSGEPALFAELKSRFDAMHDVMFGPAFYFTPVSKEERSSSFERITPIDRSPHASYLVATAKAHAVGTRDFAHIPRHIVLTSI